MLGDKEGNAKDLSNSSNCGTWILRSPSGFVTLRSSYDGCYVYEQDYKYITTLLIERELISGKWMHPQIKELKCPKLGAINRSTPDYCSVVPHRERIACASSPISRHMCNKRGCCFDGEDQMNTCYYGNKVTIQCTKDVMISIAVSKDLTQSPLRMDSIHMMRGREAACSPTLKTAGFVLFQFSLSACGTTSKERDGTVIYENVMVAEVDVKSQVTDTELGSPLRLHIQCSLEPSDPSSQNAGTLIPSSPLPDAGPKPPTLQMRFAKDDLYTKYYTDGEYPVVKQTQDSIPIEIRILQSTELNFTLILHRCWATPTADSEHELAWLFLDNGCPLTGGENTSQEMSPAAYNGLSSPSQYKRFLININHMERYVKMATNGLVYFHCRASACPHDTLEPCISLCHQGNQRPVRETARNMTILVSSKGPVFFPPAQESNIFGKGSPVPNEPLDKEWVRIVIVVGILSVILGVIYLVKRRSKAPSVKN